MSGGPKFSQDDRPRNSMGRGFGSAQSYNNPSTPHMGGGSGRGSTLGGPSMGPSSMGRGSSSMGRGGAMPYSSQRGLPDGFSNGGGSSSHSSVSYNTFSNSQRSTPNYN